ncbi:glycosyl transferase family 1 [Colwellia sp. 75C3]|uniref:glycosyltransferase family 4 protein n=1 Tax=Colwellia sp. 75C3 TaxID=888425 RepID=UPI000C333B27|nr:glycosyltransferase family 4 protein [Colwellia sp. 75C3]PKG82546.1 glycosyl transferase family 1 [Colwellia sp. 75C3]
MKVLLSAYACEPNKGSEPGVGWHWAQEVAKLKHDVTVLTRKNNQEVISEYYSNNKQPDNLSFIYYDLPKWLSWWKKGGRGVRFYYFLWQIGAFFTARSVHEKSKFDQVQHITFVSVRQPSFMGLLGIPFVFGPVAGGDSAPLALRAGFSLKAKIRDRLRDIINYCVGYDPFMHLTFYSADKIFVTSEQTKKLIPAIHQNKVRVQLAIGVESKNSAIQGVQSGRNDSSVRVLYVGRFDYLKALPLAIRSFAQALKQSELSLTLVGSGPEKKSLNTLVNHLGVEDKVHWIDWVPQNELARIYREHDVFIFPSLRDSGGMVVLEAMAEGLPVVCLNLGGPGVIVNEGCGISIDTNNKYETDVIEELAKALVLLQEDKHTFYTMQEGAVDRAREMTWAGVVGKVYGE